MRYLFKLCSVHIPPGKVVVRGIRQLVTLRAWRFANGDVSWKVVKP